jgi:serine/threonine-protein kinase
MTSQAKEEERIEERASAAMRSGLRATDPLLSAVINGKYRVVGMIATGGMGRIYRAEQAPLGRLVAIKVLRSLRSDVGSGEPTTDASGSAISLRFFREASVLAKVQHPNVVTVYDYGPIEEPASESPGEGDRVFMAMEFLDGETVQQRLDRGGRLPVAETIEFVRQMALGLRAAHARGIVHRDLKPSNLMIVKVGDGEEILKLVDFGVTKVLNDVHDQDLTASGIVVGSPPFMAPEQLVGGEVDQRTDIYSLGLTAYTMLSGASPFVGRSPAKTMWAHLNEPVPSLAPARPDVPAWLDEVIQRCAAKDPAARFQTVDSLLDTLRARIPSTRPEPPPEMPTPARGLAWPAPRPPPEESGETLRPTSDEIGPRAPSPSESSEFFRPRRSRAKVVIAALAVLGVAVGFAVGSGSSSSSPAPASSVAAAPPAPGSMTYRLSIVSTPPEAEVFEGGMLVGRTPLVMTVPAGTGVAHVELRRAGYAAYAYDLSPTHDTEIVAVLTPDRAAAKAPAPAAPSSRRWTPPARGTPRPTPAPSDPFDKI